MTEAFRAERLAYERERVAAANRSRGKMREASACAVLSVVGYRASLQEIRDQVERDRPKLSHAEREALLETCARIQITERERARRLDPDEVRVTPLDQILDEDDAPPRPGGSTTTKEDADMGSPNNAKLTTEQRDEARAYVAQRLRADPNVVRERIREELERKYGIEISAGSWWSTYLQPAKDMLAAGQEADDEPAPAVDVPPPAVRPKRPRPHGPKEAGRATRGPDETAERPRPPEVGESGDASEAGAPTPAEAEPAPARGDARPRAVEFPPPSGQQIEVRGEGGCFRASAGDGGWSVDVRIEGLSYSVVSVLLHYMSRALFAERRQDETDTESERNAA